MVTIFIFFTGWSATIIFRKMSTHKSSKRQTEISETFYFSNYEKKIVAGELLKKIRMATVTNLFIIKEQELEIMLIEK